MIKEKLKEIASRCRDKLVIKYHDPTLLFRCLEASEYIKFVLNINGIKARVIEGTFYVDCPNPSLYPEDYGGHFDSEEEMLHEMHYPLHYWVEVGDFVVDVTASQFNGEIDVPMPDVVVDNSDSLSRHRKYLPEEREEKCEERAKTI